jgi:hypothetical protein
MLITRVSNTGTMKGFPQLDDTTLSPTSEERSVKHALIGSVGLPTAHTGLDNTFTICAHYSPVE